MKVFPNPSAGAFTVLLEEAAQVERISLYDAAGRLVHQLQSPTQSQVELELPNAAPGMYFLHVQGVDWVEQQRIVIQ